MSVNCYCITRPGGDSFVCRAGEGKSLVHDVFIVKMVLEPETKRRYFSFSPAKPLSWNQSMGIEEFKALSPGANVYPPAEEVVAAYRQFVESPERVRTLLAAYLTECGPCKEWLDKNMPQKTAGSRGKILQMGCRELDEEGI